MQPSLELEVLHVREANPATPRLRLVVLNNSASIVKMLCDLFTQHGHQCEPKLLSDMPRAYKDVERFLALYRPHVVVYDVGMPYASSWDLLEAIRVSPELQSQPFVITTPNKGKLDEAVGRTDALEISEHTRDLRRLLQAVIEAADGAGQSR